jgi:alpha-glucuronidase
VGSQVCKKRLDSPLFPSGRQLGIGFDRTQTGSNAVSQYNTQIGSQFSDLKTCPEIYLLWFHHLPWDYKMKSGKTLWDELCYHYDAGLQQVRQFQKIWDMEKSYVDLDRFTRVQSKLRDQSRNAQVWKDACLLYFQQFSHKPIPYDIERPVNDLEDLINNVSNRIKK